MSNTRRRRKNTSTQMPPTMPLTIAQRVGALEVSLARNDEQTKALTESVRMLKQSVYGVLAISFLGLLLTVIFGAVGGKGFYAVTNALKTVSVQTQEIK